MQRFTSSADGRRLAKSQALSLAAGAPQRHHLMTSAGGLKALLYTNADVISASAFWGSDQRSTAHFAAVQDSMYDAAAAAVDAPGKLQPNSTQSSGTQVKLLAALFEGSQSKASNSTSFSTQDDLATEVDATVTVTVPSVERAPSIKELLQTWESLSSAQPPILSRSNSSSTSSSSSSFSSSCSHPLKPCLRPLTAASTPSQQQVEAAASGADVCSPVDAAACALPAAQEAMCCDEQQQQQQQQQQQRQEVQGARQWNTAMSLMVTSAVVSGLRCVALDLAWLQCGIVSCACQYAGMGICAGLCA